MSVIVITGNPVSGLNFYGPFDTANEAVEYGHRNDEGGDWWVAPLVTPEPEQQVLPLHYPGADVPIPPAGE